jgi:hypothetical protein
MARTTRRGAATALLLHGEERFLVDEKARRTVEEWRSELVSDFGLETIEGAGLAPARLPDAVLRSGARGSGRSAAQQIVQPPGA